MSEPEYLEGATLERWRWQVATSRGATDGRCGAKLECGGPCVFAAGHELAGEARHACAGDFDGPGTCAA